MGKTSRSRKAFTTPNKQAVQNVKGKVHVNDPTRRPAATHDSVKKATRARATQKAENLNNNDAIFDGGAGAQ
jgi:hypothetical protein